MLNALLFTGVGDINQHLYKQGAGSTWGKTSSCLLEAQGFGPNKRDFSFGSFSKCGSITDYWRKKAGVSNLGPCKNPGGDLLSSCCSVHIARMSDRYPISPWLRSDCTAPPGEDLARSPQSSTPKLPLTNVPSSAKCSALVAHLVVGTAPT